MFFSLVTNLHAEDKEKKKMEEALKRELEIHTILSTDIENNFKTLMVLYPIENLFTVTFKENDIVNTFNIRKNQLYVLDIGIDGNLNLRPVETSEMYSSPSSLFIKLSQDTFNLEMFVGEKKYVIGFTHTYRFDTVYLISGRNSLANLSVTFNGMKQFKKTVDDSKKITIN
jgi:hypothetical protein